MRVELVKSGGERVWREGEKIGGGEPEGRDQ
jgi:hypothetical protein